MSENVAKEGSKVSVEYTGTLDDGEKFDTSEGREPLVFTIDEKQVVKGFNDAVKGMKVGEEKEFKLEPKDAYGDQNPQLIQEVPIDKLPENVEAKVGMVLALKGPDGKQYGARIIELGEKTFKIDLNHPLAGKNLTFKIKVVKVE
ncbi:peptidylprolyl isomerase [Candidatus Woesearchaeota archaeon]|jgi:FKBP-type peptidyl-prolyl cis-trans isomerase 2|nr:peptidylprolyl isomerase [Candidatus Woesearchaeota archaeon]MBT5273178.1 peptidylprolyl isomerase [Candidatus Woesearchaeota archaeon]MBT6041205.1 peptidylprolyl isomerase [Candidatus Woesearchaeota archaeon]MBT6337507.1 peptidylprolyl isomerase [Candidatus Woesearchaeota archaeon]MBT7927092.1 peptidylprolyl isomerase [Candidatus Woesearchaeota archaeon]